MNWTPLPVPWAVQAVDRIPKQRYYDEEFYALEAELFWPRVWQMACRLEEIPSRGDFVEYEILDQSVIVVRLDDESVRAYYNSCRHRGMKIVEGSGSRRNFVCPFHGWCWGLDGANTFVLRPDAFDDGNLGADDLRPRFRQCCRPLAARITGQRPYLPAVGQQVARSPAGPRAGRPGGFGRGEKCMRNKGVIAHS